MISKFVSCALGLLLLAGCSRSGQSAARPREANERKVGVLLVSHGSHSESWRRMLLDVELSARDGILSDPTCLLRLVNATSAKLLEATAKKEQPCESIRLNRCRSATRTGNLRFEIHPLARSRQTGGITSVGLTTVLDADTGELVPHTQEGSDW